MTGRAFVLALCALLCACHLGGASPAARPDVAAREAGDFRISDDELALTMRAIGKQLESAGLEPGRDSFRGFLTTGARSVHRLALPAETCATLIAIASRGVHDMDAALYSPEGDLLAIDSQPDAHPTLQVCTGGEPRALYYALQLYEGAGSFIVAMFLGEPATLDRAAKLLGARPALARLGPAESDGPGRVAAFRDGLLRRGFEPIQPPTRVPLARDQGMRVPLRVKPGQCYTAAGFAVDGLRNVDLRVLDDEGSEVARDESHEEDATAQFCTNRRAEYAAELRGVEGDGAALFVLFQADAASIGGSSGLWLGERPLAEAARRPLDAALEAVARRSEADGFKLSRTLRTGRLAPGEAIAQPYAVTAQRCARIHAVGGPGVRRLALIAKDGDGRTLASAEGGAETTYIHLCSSAPRAVDLQVHAVSGTGPFAIAAYEAVLSAVVPAGADERVAEALMQALMQARDAGYQPLAEYARGPQKLALGRAEPLAMPIAAGPARCLRAYVVSSERNARAQLWADGAPVDAPVLDGQPARFCATGDEKPSPIELRLWTSAAAASDAWLIVLARQ